MVQPQRSKDQETERAQLLSNIQTVEHFSNKITTSRQTSRAGDPKEQENSYLSEAVEIGKSMLQSPVYQDRNQSPLLNNRTKRSIGTLSSALDMLMENPGGVDAVEKEQHVKSALGHMLDCLRKPYDPIAEESLTKAVKRKEREERKTKERNGKCPDYPAICCSNSQPKQRERRLANHCVEVLVSEELKKRREMLSRKRILDPMRTNNFGWVPNENIRISAVVGADEPRREPDSNQNG